MNPMRTFFHKGLSKRVLSPTHTKSSTKNPLMFFTRNQWKVPPRTFYVLALQQWGFISPDCLPMVLWTMLWRTMLYSTDQNCIWDGCFGNVLGCCSSLGQRAPVLVPTGTYGTQNNLYFPRVLLIETILCGALVHQEPLFWNPYFEDRWIRRPRKGSDFVKLVNIPRICCVNGLTHHPSVSLHILLFRQRLQSGASALSGCSRTSVAPRIQLVSPPARERERQTEKRRITGGSLVLLPPRRHQSALMTSVNSASLPPSLPGMPSVIGSAC